MIKTRVKKQVIGEAMAIRRTMKMIGITTKLQPVFEMGKLLVAQVHDSKRALLKAMARKRMKVKVKMKMKMKRMRRTHLLKKFRQTVSHRVRVRGRRYLRSAANLSALTQASLRR
jgi:hypothetical protein